MVRRVVGRRRTDWGYWRQVIAARIGGAVATAATLSFTPSRNIAIVHMVALAVAGVVVGAGTAASTMLAMVSLTGRVWSAVPRRLGAVAGHFFASSTTTMLVSSCTKNVCAGAGRSLLFGRLV